MRTVKVGLAVVLVVAIVVVGGGIGALAWVTGRALPETSGTMTARGLEAPVTVVRDVAGIPHITASSPHDLFLAQGYVHAQERMWQMEVWRRIGSGRLSEVFGAGTLDTDRFIRTVGWRRAAERDLAAVAPEARAVLDAYAAGVNAWLDDHRGRLGLAFLVTGADPEPWTALDTLAWGKVQAWNLGGNMESELFRYLADARLEDAARTDALLAPPDGPPVITPTGLPGSGGAGAGVSPTEPSSGMVGQARGGQASTADPDARATDGLPDGDARLSDGAAAAWGEVAGLGDAVLEIAGLDAADGLASDGGIGSNNWVVGPGLSATGGALIANDPHLGISMPSIWFINGLHCEVVDAGCPYDVAGVSFPGVPGVILGHNARIAWGATNVDPDVQDLVVETIDPADPDRYLAPGGRSAPFVSRIEEIRVAGGSSVQLEVRETEHGPVLNGVDERLAGAPPMALRWTATNPSAGPDRTFEAVLGLNTADSFAAFQDSLQLYGGPSQNFVYADVDGHIGYQLPGRIPVRSDPADRGERPVSGSDGTGEWGGWIPFQDLPSQYDPEPGYIITANNAAVDEAFPAFIGREWDPGYRAERIIDTVQRFGQDGLTTAEMATIQNDTAPLRARDIVPLLEDAEPSTEDGLAIADGIRTWDGSCGVDSLGCAAYATWEYRVLRGLVDDELGGLAREYVGSAFSWVFLARQLDEPLSPWWDDITTTDVVETADMIVLRAMDEAGAELRAALGGPNQWSWGRLHTATFEEATLGTSGIGPLEWYFNEGPTAVPGTSGAVDAAGYRLSRAYPDPTDPDVLPLGVGELFTVATLPSYRLTMDMSDLDGAQVVITTGQSGHPFDRHYNDLVDRWRKGESVPLPFSSAAIEAAAVSTLTLTP